METKMIIISMMMKNTKNTKNTNSSANNTRPATRKFSLKKWNYCKDYQYYSHK